MPHAVLPQEAENEELLELAREGDVGEGGLNFSEFLNGANDQELQPGEKNVDAQDYADISDDDLIEDLGSLGHNTYIKGGAVVKAEERIPDGQAQQVDDDDLFGELSGYDDLFEAPSSPGIAADGFNGLGRNGHSNVAILPHSTVTYDDAPHASPSFLEDLAYTQDCALGIPDFQDDFFGEESDIGAEEDDDTREQRALFAKAERARDRARGIALGEVPDAPQTDDELFALIWPQFEADKPPRFGELLPGKRAFYLGKASVKPPKPVQPTKVSLEVLPDQERSFRLSSSLGTDQAPQQESAASSGVLQIVDDENDRESGTDDADLQSADEDEPVGGFTLQDLSLLCEDWDVQLLDSVSSPGGSRDGRLSPAGSDRYGHWDELADYPPAKRRKTAHFGDDFFAVSQPVYSGIDEPELATAQVARKVTLDLNDPHLLLDLQQPDVQVQKVRRLGGDFRRGANGSLTSDLNLRYNISNDEAYARLKENQQHKVRSTLGNLAIEHSLPALRLQYPFYRVKLTPREARAHHRQVMSFVPGQNIEFSKPKFVKRKHTKGKEIQDIFKTSGDLSMGDNSSVLLLEYSEEYPVMLSNFGMASRLINYYRRKDMDDNARPKLDVGETAVLLPQDKSPFSIFGYVDPCQTVTTLQNGMFRAPVFRQEPRSTDFLVVRNRTGVAGSKYYLRNVDHVYVVGQQYPSIEVPGIHSRKVTEAAKKRLKAITYRMVNHRKSVTHAAVQAHFLGSDTAQNRAKLKEFMHYEKEKGHEEGIWKPEKGKIVPDSAAIRSWIKPEDVSLLDSMQIGQRQLQDAGYNREEKVGDGGSDEEKEGASLDEQLAPWNTSKNFLHACQGKAMLQLHGEGDPSGSGLALSFLKTSMKGGFRPIGQSVQDKIDAKAMRENGGHSYNVARQQKAYEEYIRDVWIKQRESLSSTMEPDDGEKDVDQQEDGNAPFSRDTSVPAVARRDDDTASQFSRLSTASQRGKVLKITREVVDKYGRPDYAEEIIHDHKVIREYVKRRRIAEIYAIPLDQLKPTGDPETDKLMAKRLVDEDARISRNMDRRTAREKAKGIFPSLPAGESPGSPNTPVAGTGGGSRAAGTQRKCANCGQVGHIKTNKKYCTCNAPASTTARKRKVTFTAA